MKFFDLVVCASLATSRTLLQPQITSLCELSFRFRISILLVQTKKWFLWTMAAAKAPENHGDDWGLTWYFPWGIYKWIPTWTHSQNSLVVAAALSLKLFSHLTSLKWSQRPPNQHKNSHKPCDERGHHVLSLLEHQ